MKPLIAVDCEMHGLRLYRDDLCLIQVGDDEQRVALVRPQPECPPNLKTLLTHPDVIKVFHFALSDVGFLKVRYGIDVRPLRCTRVMSKLIRTYTDRHGLKNLLQELLDVDISKHQQMSDWGAAELTKAQLDYAASDVLYLHALREKLNGRLEREGRMDMAQACFDFLPTRARLDLAGWASADIFSHE